MPCAPVVGDEILISASVPASDGSSTTYLQLADGSGYVPMQL
eukprot:SAG11_NODE_8591_length_998_cov_1.086763_2_plen_41_part_01